jgi:hypothetical protein
VKQQSAALSTEDTLIESGRFRLPGKKHLLKGFGKPTVVVMDATQTRIEGPIRHQRWFYSGKQKQHTLKCQLVIEHATGCILCTYFGKGRRHDFKLFQVSGIRFHPEIESLQDKALPGIQKRHKNSRLPQKKPRKGKLSAQAKAYNRQLARERVVPIACQSSLEDFQSLGSLATETDDGALDYGATSLLPCTAMSVPSPRDVLPAPRYATAWASLGFT